MQKRNTSDTVVERLIQWAEQQELVRAMVLTSSRTNSVARVDPLSDYDVILVVSDNQPFTDYGWLSNIGTPLVRLPDATEYDSQSPFTRLVLYDDGIKIDYTIWPVALLEHVRTQPRLPDVLDVGYQVLIDKDDLARGLQPPTCTAHIPHRPTEQEFLALVEEFWWESTYVAKNLWRDELMFAKYNLDVVMKLELLRQLLEWRVELDHDWAWKPGMYGRGLKKMLDGQTWSALENTYVGAEIEENWRALFRTIELFRRVAIEIGAALGYSYPHDLDRQVMQYLHGIRNLAK